MDGRRIQATLFYEPLNRLTDKHYSDFNATPPTPWAHYGYQANTDIVASVTAGTTIYSYSNYDALGRAGAGSQTTSGQTYTFPSVVWTPQGQVAQITYPSGRVVTTTFDQAGRFAGLSGPLSGSTTNYVSGTSYAAQGALTGMTTGESLARSFTYNARLQPTQVVAGTQLTIGLGWNGNGTLQSETITRPGLSATTQNYTYDGVNRLQTAMESPSWNQTYVYDKVGNRAITGGSSMLVSNYTPQSPDGATVPFDGSNHWQLAAGYDSAGNMTGLRTQTMGYDAESRMISWADSSTGAIVVVGYDGDGRRVTKTSSSGTTVYVYDPSGNLAVEYGGTPPAASGTLYLTQDHLGSTRLVTNSAGCVGAHDYLPFGEEIPSTFGRGSVPCYGQTDTAVKFTGQERDAETNLDNFLARHMGASQGRFLSVDPDNAGAEATNPQSWNGYGYAWNNPLLNIDPSGRDCVSTDGGDTFHEENSGETTCASSTVPSFSTTATTTAPWDFGEQAFVGFGNLFFNGQLSGAKDLALGVASLFPNPTNIALSLASSGQGQQVLAAAFNGAAPVAKGKAGVERAAKELVAAGNKILGRNVSIQLEGGRRIIADLVIEAVNGETVIVEVKNGANAGFTANQILSGLSDGARITGEIRGTGSFASTLGVGSMIEDAASFVIRYIH